MTLSRAFALLLCAAAVGCTQQPVAPADAAGAAGKTRIKATKPAVAPAKIRRPNQIIAPDMVQKPDKIIAPDMVQKPTGIQRAAR